MRPTHLQQAVVLRPTVVVHTEGCPPSLTVDLFVLLFPKKKKKKLFSAATAENVCHTLQIFQMSNVFSFFFYAISQLEQGAAIIKSESSPSPPSSLMTAGGPTTNGQLQFQQELMQQQIDFQRLQHHQQNQQQMFLQQQRLQEIQVFKKSILVFSQTMCYNYIGGCQKRGARRKNNNI